MGKLRDASGTASSNRSSFEIAPMWPHFPRNLSPIQEVLDEDVSDAASDDEVIKKLKNLSQRHAGTTSAGNRDSIDSILSKYEYTPETEHIHSVSEVKVPITSTDIKITNFDHPTTSRTARLDWGMPDTSTSNDDFELPSQHEETQALLHSNCDEAICVNYSTVVMSRENGFHGESNMASPASFSSYDSIGANASTSQSTDRSQNGTIISADGTMQSSSDCSAEPPSEYRDDTASGYMTNDHSPYVDHYKDTSRVDPDAHDILAHLYSPMDEDSAAISSSHAAPSEDIHGYSDDPTLRSHQSAYDSAIGTTSTGDVADDQHPDEKNFDNILSLLQNLEDLQHQMDDIISQDPTPSHSRPLSDYADLQIPTSSIIAASHPNAENDVTTGRDSICAEVSKDQNESEEVEQDVRNEPEEGIRAVKDFAGASDGDVGGEVVLTTALCTMLGLVFVAGLSHI